MRLKRKTNKNDVYVICHDGDKWCMWLENGTTFIGKYCELTNIVYGEWSNKNDYKYVETYKRVIEQTPDMGQKGFWTNADSMINRMSNCLDKDINDYGEAFIEEKFGKSHKFNRDVDFKNKKGE